MVELKPIELENRIFLSITVQLPKTNLLIVSSERGYIMCGALDVALLNDKLKDRNILAGRAVGVKTIKELLEAPLESITYGAEQAGIRIGMPGKEALMKM